MPKMDDALPLMARRFIASRQPHERAAQVIHRFHRWLRDKHTTASALSEQEFERFLERPFRKVVSPRTAQAYKRALFDYLQWLHERGWLDFDPRQLGLRKTATLPPSAMTFLRALEPTHRPSTRAIYSTTLRRFHGWLDDARIPLRRLRRGHVEQWLLALHDRGLHPSTRRQTIITLRCYLRWLADHGELPRDPDDLIRRSDLPKLPTYLPRPLPAAVDHALQRRLRSSPHPLARALLVMRQTGLRIGELQHLEYDCIHCDPQGHPLLKVPLGKLNNERLVPLTHETAQHIEALRARGSASRRFLLERSPDEPIPQQRLRAVFKIAIEGLASPDPITTHRLRHTYATSLLDAGMSLVGVMQLLGHRDHRMTLRYAAVTQSTITCEYHKAIERLQTHYPENLLPAGADEQHFDPVDTIDQLLAWADKTISHELGQPALAHSIAKRLRRIRSQIPPLKKTPS
jgi:site-specific recombinase XerD